MRLLSFLLLIFLPAASFAQLGEPLPPATVNGNRFEFSPVTRHTYYLTDPRISPARYVARIIHVDASLPVRVNGDTIYNDSTLQPLCKGSRLTFTDYMLRGLQHEMSLFPDGNYFFDVNQVVISAAGKVIYHNYSWMTEFSQKYPVKDSATAEMKQQFKEKMELLLNTIEMIAPRYKGKKVNVLLPRPFITMTFVVKDHQVTVL